MNENQGDNQRFYNNFDSSNNYQQFGTLWENNDTNGRTDVDFHTYLFDNEEKIQTDANATHTETDSNLNYNNRYEGGFYNVPQNMSQLNVSPNVQGSMNQPAVYPIHNMESINNGVPNQEGVNTFMNGNPPIDPSRTSPYSIYVNPVISNGTQQASIPILNPSTISFTKPPNGSVLIPNFSLSYPYQDLTNHLNNNNNMNIYPQFYSMSPNPAMAGSSSQNGNNQHGQHGRNNKGNQNNNNQNNGNNQSNNSQNNNGNKNNNENQNNTNSPNSVGNNNGGDFHFRNHYRNHQHNYQRNGDYNKRNKNHNFMTERRPHYEDQHYRSNPIDIDAIKEGKDNRTTLMIRNVPNSFSSETVLKIIDGYVKNKYDFFYLPMDQRTGCNLGYGYINMVDIQAVIDIYKNFHDKHWPNTKSQKTCNICYGRIQSIDNNLTEYCKGWSVMISPEKYRPKFFKATKKVIDGHEQTVMEEFVPPISYDMK